MNANKRFTSSKGTSSSRYSGSKSKDSSIARQDSIPSDSESILSTLPIIRQADNSKLLPRYSTILSREVNDGVNMDDLEQLQLDLENLISTCAVRNRMLHSEMEFNERIEDRRDKRGKSYDKSSSLKRKRLDDRSNRGKDPKSLGGSRPVKKNYQHLPVNSTLIGEGTILHESPKINMPKNDTSDKFWATVEPFCGAIDGSHHAFLDKLIEECSQEIDVKIPELGDYYANDWNDEAIGVEQELGIGAKSDLKKNGLSVVGDTFANPKAQRLLAVLIEERVMTSFPRVTGKLKPSDLNILKAASGPRAAICMDRRLKKDLIEQGILQPEDLPKDGSDDEILQEIKKCQQELATVNEYNVEELNRLKSIVVKDLKRQEIKSALGKVDSQVLELYNRLTAAKQKHLQQPKEEDVDKSVFNKYIKEFEVEADVLLKQQQHLQKELYDLSDD